MLADLKLGADKCETCQIIAQYLEALLETDTVVIQIEKFLSKGCSLFPESLHTKVCDVVLICLYKGLQNEQNCNYNSRLFSYNIVNLSVRHGLILGQ